MKTTEVLKLHNKLEEAKMHEVIKSISKSEYKLIVTGESISEITLHFRLL